MKYSKKTVENAWKALVRRLHGESQYHDEFWTKPKPAFKSHRGRLYLDLVFGKGVSYDAGICDHGVCSTYPDDRHAVRCLVREKIPGLKHDFYTATMRQMKCLSPFEFKRIWLETALGHTLYKLSGLEPFITKDDTIEYLALEQEISIEHSLHGEDYLRAQAHGGAQEQEMSLNVS